MKAVKFDLEQKQSSKLGKLYIPVAILLVFLVLAEIWVSHSLVTHGEQFKNIENLQTVIKNENQLLENQIDELSSLSKLASNSAGLGM